VSMDALKGLLDQWERDAPEMGEELPEGEVLAYCAGAIREALSDGIVFQRLLCQRHRKDRPRPTGGDPWARHAWFDHDGGWWCPGVERLSGVNDGS